MNYSESLKRLMQGWQKYLQSKSNPASFSKEIRKYLKENGQYPYAAIVTCGDSRVPVEHIFSAGIGELFVVRNAGNVIGDFELGSIEYAVEHLGVSLVIVLGHTRCGAVYSTIHQEGHSYIKSITDEINKAVNGETNLRKCEILNAKNSVKALQKSPIISKLEEEDKLKVIPAIYDIESGNIVLYETSGETT